MSQLFAKKVAAITGAGSGIGRALAIGLAQEGATVHIADRNAEGLAETAELIGAGDARAFMTELDVSSEIQVGSWIEQIGSTSGRLDAAFNNAGITGPALPIENYPLEDFQRVIAVNLQSVFLGMKYQIPLIKRSGGGAIVNTASVAALTGPGGMSAYAASKHGVHGLTRVAAMENAVHGIRVNAIAPGWTETPMVVANSQQNPGFAALARNAIPAKRGGRPEEIAAAAIWLASNPASYVTGHMLTVDGGMTIGGFEL
ncbi:MULTISPECIES: SDR family NAD(P)-dependent oxidoreductase [unclassified Ensifer]|uniref:SDR family NAD(P)-dependent oxidoreductase n=1 Tax=unclassified Ensifer TaxID=2633371 RepID=UPI00070A1015|nr:MULTISPECIES: SDR family NAD(P)-dependent oxidoreductase [unclassified Ensifer]KQW34765.1 short-chain dehydrogenase [Ensifer sp. Root1252]KQW68311.1 short-chain dehydrogenase [Ensifer sp. Root127]KRC57091.1 short-chain dehydrogenase [Ensifer sp. Root231]KRC87586.1 short-chain dehydrogenase [Ensifer sp. Root258]